MTIEAVGLVESMSVGLGDKILVSIRLESSRSQVLIEVLATREELSTLYYPGKQVNLQIRPKP